VGGGKKCEKREVCEAECGRDEWARKESARKEVGEEGRKWKAEEKNGRVDRVSQREGSLELCSYSNRGWQSEKKFASAYLSGVDGRVGRDLGGGRVSVGKHVTPLEPRSRRGVLRQSADGEIEMKMLKMRRRKRERRGQ
jgi:hypothetical protein